MNPCTVCNVDMGPQNPRQLCGKTHCLSEDSNPEHQSSQSSQSSQSLQSQSLELKQSQSLEPKQSPPEPKPKWLVGASGIVRVSDVIAVYHQYNFGSYDIYARVTTLERPICLAKQVSERWVDKIIEEYGKQLNS